MKIFLFKGEKMTDRGVIKDKRTQFIHFWRVDKLLRLHMSTFLTSLVGDKGGSRGSDSLFTCSLNLWVVSWRDGGLDVCCVWSDSKSRDSSPVPMVSLYDTTCDGPKMCRWYPYLFVTFFFSGKKKEKVRMFQRAVGDYCLRQPLPLCLLVSCQGRSVPSCFTPKSRLSVIILDRVKELNERELRRGWRDTEETTKGE